MIKTKSPIYGASLVRFRELRGLSGYQLADLLGENYRKVYRMEVDPRPLKPPEINLALSALWRNLPVPEHDRCEISRICALAMAAVAEGLDPWTEIERLIICEQHPISA